MRRSASLAALLALLLPMIVRAHVGSPDVVFEGQAGPHAVRVTVRPPQAIPGLADIVVRELGAPSAREVTVQPLRWDARGKGGAPPPDRAERVRGQDGLWSGALWIMTQGSYAVRVEVKADGGDGVVMVPVAAAPTRTLELDAALGATLGVMALLLLAGAVSIVGAAVREAVVPVGDSADRRRRVRAAVAMGIAVLLLGVMMRGGWRWWGAVDAWYRGNLYRPIRVATTVRAEEGGSVLRLAFDNDERRLRQWGPLTADHGKLMHLFLIREDSFDAVAHLHPVPVPAQRDVFEAPLPRLPEGRYRLYADVTHENGFAHTLTATVHVPASSRAQPGDPDDSWHLGPTRDESRADLGGGYVLVRDAADAVLGARSELALRFRVRDAAGAPVAPEPYMGMAAHAVVTRDDGSVFVHLHPSGTVSMASQQLFAAGGEGVTADTHAAHRLASPALSFPYEFPQPGRYRMWVQVKVAGVVRTGAFTIDVLAAS